MKRQKKEVITIRLSKVDKLRLKLQAHRNKKTMSAYLVNLINKDIDNEKDK